MSTYGGDLPTLREKITRWVRRRVFAYRVERLCVGAHVSARVGSKGGRGIVRQRYEVERGAAYVVEFPDLGYPHTMVCPTGTYHIDARDVYDIHRVPGPKS